MSAAGVHGCGAYPIVTGCKCGGTARFLQWGGMQGAYYYCETRDDCRGFFTIDWCEGEDD